MTLDPPSDASSSVCLSYVIMTKCVDNFGIEYLIRYSLQLMEEMIIICFIPVLSLVSKTQDQDVGYRTSYRKKLLLVQHGV